MIKNILKYFPNFKCVVITLIKFNAKNQTIGMNQSEEKLGGDFFYEN